jgi:Meiotically up-regulated gene 113
MSIAKAEERARIVVAIQKLGAANGGIAPGKIAFHRAAGFPREAWRKHWFTWGDAVREAGCRPNDPTPPLDEEKMLAQFAALARDLKRIPPFYAVDLHRSKGAPLPARSSYRRHFGNKDGLLVRLKRWAEADPERSDVLNMVLELGTAGVVYMIRCGEFCKIGYTREGNSRIQHIRNLLPQDSELVHAIETDDALGVEAYWHRRFAENRVRGEWFKLTDADIDSFRKWRF